MITFAVFRSLVRLPHCDSKWLHRHQGGGSISVERPSLTVICIVSPKVYGTTEMVKQKAVKIEKGPATLDH